MEELHHSLNRYHDTAVGPDKIHYQFLKHLPESSLRVLLHAFNNIWQTGQIPSSWQEATIIPIPKRITAIPTNYHPIALTSCICKPWRGWSTTASSGRSRQNVSFQNTSAASDEAGQPSTTWSGLKLSCVMPLLQNSMPLPCFSTLEKAYDTTWR